MKRPKVSIIIPVYNVEPFLRECVESARNQTLTDTEIVLVDDESPDCCPAICDEYVKKDNRIKVVHKKNGGLGFARNSGLDVATGEYIAFLDSDDYEKPETYETIYNIAKSNNCDAVYYKFDVNPKEKVSCQIYNGESEVRGVLLNMIANPPESKNERDIQVSSCIALYRREIIESRSIRFHSERELISEDLVFNIDFLCQAKRIAVTNYPFYHYRVTLESLTHTVRRDRHEKNKFFYLYLINRIKSLGYEGEGKDRCARLFIGYTRATLFQICRSRLRWKEKCQLTKQICSDAIWQNLKNEYPYKRMPFKYRMFFQLMIKNRFILIWLMSKV